MHGIEKKNTYMEIQIQEKNYTILNTIYMKPKKKTIYKRKYTNKVSQTYTTYTNYKKNKQVNGETDTLITACTEPLKQASNTPRS